MKNIATLLYSFCSLPGDVNLGRVEVLVVLEGGELLGVPESHGSYHISKEDGLTSAAALGFELPLCTHTETEGKPREARVRNIF